MVCAVLVAFVFAVRFEFGDEAGAVFGGKRLAAERAGRAFGFFQSVDALFQIVHFGAQAGVFGFGFGLAVEGGLEGGFELGAVGEFGFEGGDLGLEIGDFGLERADLRFEGGDLGLLLMEVGLLFFEEGAFFLDFGEGGVAAGFVGAEAGGGFVPSGEVGAGLRPLVVGCLNFWGAGEGVGEGVAFAETFPLAGEEVGVAGLGGGALAVEGFNEFALFVQRGGDLAGGFDDLLLGGTGLAEGFELGLQFRETGFPGDFFVQFGVDFLEATVEVFDVTFDEFAAVGGGFAVGFPGFEAKDTAEDTFAVRGALLGELVGFALEEEGGVDKGVVVEAEGFFDATLGFA